MPLPSNLARAITIGLLYSAAAMPVLAQFETRASISTSPYLPNSLVVGDFNRDGRLDAAVVTYVFGAGNLIILLGNVDGTFTLDNSYSVAAQPQYAAAASLTKNGILDLVVGDSLSDYVYVMRGNGDGTFQPPVPYPSAGMTTTFVGIGDFTGDGKLDIITMPGGGCNCFAVLPGNGDGTFGAAITTTVSYSQEAFTMATGYFNGDHALDVAVVGTLGTASDVEILLGNGDGTFRADGQYPVSAAPQSVTMGRFNGDKAVDLAIGDNEGSQISVLLGKVTAPSAKR